jgi:hypothetical protein
VVGQLLPRLALILLVRYGVVAASDKPKLLKIAENAHQSRARKPSHRTDIVLCSEIIESRFGVPFLSVEVAGGRNLFLDLFSCYPSCYFPAHCEQHCFSTLRPETDLPAFRKNCLRSKCCSRPGLPTVVWSRPAHHCLTNTSRRTARHSLIPPKETLPPPT